MKKLWGAANIRVYGGGTHEAEFLEDVSRICGEWDAPATSTSTARGTSRTYTAATRRERVLDVSTLGCPALVPGRGHAERHLPASGPQGRLAPGQGPPVGDNLMARGDEGWEAELATSPASSKAPTQPRYSSVEDFVAEYLALVTEVRTGGPIVWCASWWAHPEAVLRLSALWRAWEALRLEPATGMSNWWTLHFDPHMRVLLDADRGPFASCARGQHQEGKPGPLPLTEPPKDWKMASLRRPPSPPG